MPHRFAAQPFIIQPPDDLLHLHPELQRESLALSQKYRDGQIVTDEELKRIGEMLWQALNTGKDWVKAVQQKRLKILPICLKSDAPTIQALPWELLFEPQYGFLAKHPEFTFSRCNSLEQSEPIEIEKGPLRILLFTSSPDDLDPEHERLHFEEEQIQIQEVFLPLIAKGVVQLEIPDDGTFATFRELLTSFQPHLVFLSGHGEFHNDPVNNEYYGVFNFEGQDGMRDPVNEEQLSHAFVGTGVQCVVLSACESGKSTAHSFNKGLMQRLLKFGIPHVVGMRESVSDAAGIQFAKVFSQMIFNQERVDLAVQYARQEIDDPSSSLTHEEQTYQWHPAQWCLPALLTVDPALPLINWEFEPLQIQKNIPDLSLQDIPMPKRFIGRRKELRQLKQRLINGEIEKVYFSGPGGNGKTALAAKLASDLSKHGWPVFAWSAQGNNPFAIFKQKMIAALQGENVSEFDRYFENDPGKQAAKLIDLLQKQFDRPLVLFWDNLETVQDADSRLITDPEINAWLEICANRTGVILLITSRFQLPDWKWELQPLERTNYGDFLQITMWMIQHGLIQPKAFQNRQVIRSLYQDLGGNIRGLEFFASAISLLKDIDAEEMLRKSLVQAQGEIQQNMSIQAIYAHLSFPARQLLARLWVYPVPVPCEGMIKLGLDLNNESNELLDELFAYSLVEAQWQSTWQVNQFQISQHVQEWLSENALLNKEMPWPRIAADYQEYLYQYERQTLAQAQIVHAALCLSEQKDRADVFALEFIINSMSLQGFYHTLLRDWLPPICQSEDIHNRAIALSQTGAQLFNIGDYANALDYLKKSLKICRRISDKGGECANLNNISQIFSALGKYSTSFDFLQQSLKICQEINDKACESTTLNNISTLYYIQGKYSIAIAYLKQSLRISIQIDDKISKGATLNNIAEIYKAQGKNKIAFNYLLKSLKIRRQIGDKAGEWATLNNISQIYVAQGDEITALAYLKQSLAICQQIGDKAGICATLYNIGFFHLQNNEIDEAFSAWITVYILASSINNAHALKALAGLAPEIGLPHGLEGWKKLAQQRTKNDEP
jgi:tetratricopeptide (TPR) repeat protein